MKNLARRVLILMAVAIGFMTIIFSGSSAFSANSKASVRLPMVIIEGNGKNSYPFGCGDSIVLKNIDASNGSLYDAYNALLNYSTGSAQGQPGNPFNYYQGKLVLNSVSQNGESAAVYFSGNYESRGQCSDSRDEAQLVWTALPFGVNKVKAYIDGVEIRDIQGKTPANLYQGSDISARATGTKQELYTGLVEFGNITVSSKLNITIQLKMRIIASQTAGMGVSAVYLNGNRFPISSGGITDDAVFALSPNSAVNIGVQVEVAGKPLAGEGILIIADNIRAQFIGGGEMSLVGPPYYFWKEVK